MNEFPYGIVRTYVFSFYGFQKLILKTFDQYSGLIIGSYKTLELLGSFVLKTSDLVGSADSQAFSVQAAKNKTNV